MPRVPRHLLWLAAIVVLAALVRFGTLDLQSYRHDEAVTAGRVLHASLFDTLSTIPRSESTPPLYYLLAWLWSVPFGTGEIALRSLSALAGIALIPVVYLIGALMLSRRTGLIAAAIVAVNPVLVWFSQDARAYSLVVLLGAVSFLFFVKALKAPGRRTFACWALASGLALATHYFALFLVAPEALLLLALVPNRRVTIAATATVVAVGAMLLPLALDQANNSSNDWIGKAPLGKRIDRTAAKFVGDDTGDEHGSRQSGPLPLAVPGALVVGGLLLLGLRGDRRERSGAGLALAVGAAAVLTPIALSLVGPDYFLGRNVLVAFVPLTLVVASGFGARRAGGLGIAGTAALCLAMLAFVVEMNRAPRLQREDLRNAATAIGSPRGPRAIVTVNYFADVPLEYYLGAHRAAGGAGWFREIDVVGYGTPGRRDTSRLPAAFRRVVVRPVTYNFTLTKFAAPRFYRIPIRKLSAGALVGVRGRAAVLVGGR